jgi:predicted lipoprotein with Yx(FWY)xxD motif
MRRAATLVTGAVVLLAACGGGGDSSAGAGKSGDVSVQLRHTSIGPILADASGRTLYLFGDDKAGRSTCFGTCAQVWPPALVTGKPRPGPGVAASKLTTTPRGSAKQLVYNGHPLYRLDADTQPGQMGGEGFLGTWWVVSPGGRRVVAPGVSTKKTGY